MPMSLRIEAATNGGDDAEALATVLDLLAAKVREAAGDPVVVEGEQAVTHSHGEQVVHFVLEAHP